MKKMILTGLLSVSLLALTQCTKSEEEAFAPMQGSKAELQADVVSSRTIAEGLTTSWAADDAMKVWIGEGESYINCGEFTLPEANLSTGIFTGTMPDSYDAAKSYDWYAVYPYASANYDVAANPDKVTMLVGTNIQRQTGGYNSNAHIADAVAPLYGVTKGVEAGERPQLQMKHLTTLVKIVVTNLDEEPLEVEKIAIEAEQNAIAGRAGVTLTGDEPTYA
ncbi:MAG: fimbrillin family protein, partial [Alistipes sp.]|nr:fimbrillin family protein [Alistipes sp.]